MSDIRAISLPREVNATSKPAEETLLTKGGSGVVDDVMWAPPMALAAVHPVGRLFAMAALFSSCLRSNQVKKQSTDELSWLRSPPPGYIIGSAEYSEPPDETILQMHEALIDAVIIKCGPATALQFSKKHRTNFEALVQTTKLSDSMTRISKSIMVFNQGDEQLVFKPEDGVIIRMSAHFIGMKLLFRTGDINCDKIKQVSTPPLTVL